MGVIFIYLKWNTRHTNWMYTQTTIVLRLQMMNNKLALHEVMQASFNWYRLIISAYSLST